MASPRELKPDALYHRCDPAGLLFETTDEAREFDEVLGQPRASAAVAFGIGITRDGYNIFAHGRPGTGKESLVRHQVSKRAQEQPVPADLCYVNNFAEANKPRLLRVPPGTGMRLRRDMASFIGELRTTLASAFESEEYLTRRQVIENEFKERPQEQLGAIEERAKAEGLVLLRTPVGLAFAPTRNGEVLSGDEFEQLPQDEQERLKTRVQAFQEEGQRALRQLPRWDRERREKIRELDREVSTSAVGQLLEELQRKYADLPDVLAYLGAVQGDVIDHAHEFVRPEPPLPFILQGPGAQGGPAIMRRFEINVLVDHGTATGAPIVFEDNPTYDNLIGRIEHTQQFGALVTDFTLIKPGALHRANGGYLIIEARRLLRSPYAWEALKRCLQSHRVKIESLGQALGLVSTVSVEPEPAPLDVQVIMLGEPLLYYLLCELDPEFSELFKVVADFDDRMDGTPENQRRYGQLVATLVRKEGLRPFHRDAVARVIEHSARLVGDQRKLSARFGTVTDLLRESDYWARHADHPVVSARHVQQAIDARIHRLDRVRERVLDETVRGTLQIDTAGAVVGQINGLAVTPLGDFEFGHPTRITARARLGQGDVVDIEREVELGGPIHSKGVLILEAFLGGRYVPGRPLSLSGSLVFEQTYSGIEGDSASSAELFALLSAIAEIPLKQTLAVTGSVNQHGHIQAIGGVNEKVEGFFDLCNARGLTGEHGVLIPAANVQHLMLRNDVVEAVAAGTFHLYPIGSVDDGIELLTGLAAGERDTSGQYPPNSFNYRVETRLVEFAEERKAFRTASDDDDDSA